MKTAHVKSKVAVIKVPAHLKEELDAVIETAESDKRWSDEAEAILVHYYTTTEATISTLCKVLEKAYPDKTWPYSVVNSKLQYLKKLGCFGSKKSVK